MMKLNRGLGVCAGVALALSLSGCGDGGGSGGTESTTGGTGGSGSPFGGTGPTGTTGGGGGIGGSPSATDNTLFSPEVQLEYVGTVTDPGMEITALTIREDWLNEVVWLAAIQSTLDQPLCAIDMRITFLDSAGAELGRGSSSVEESITRGVSGTGSFTRCLMPGDTGMAVDIMPTLAAADIASVARVTYDFGAMILTDAVRTQEITVTNVQIVDEGSDRYHFTGTLNNGSDESVSNPSVSVFGTNAVGRPLAEGSDIELTTIPPGGSWSFETLSFYVPVVDYVAFPDVSSL